MDEHFCQFPEGLILEARQSRWGKRRVGLAILGALPGISEDDHLACLAAVCKAWNGHAGITLYPADTGRTDIRMSAGPIDRKGGTLAWSELPNGSDGALKQLYDTSEDWWAGLDPVAIPSRAVPLFITMAHEVGHALGLNHSKDTRSLMYPSLNRKAWGPQDDDIRELVERYGPPEQAPSPDVPPTGGYVFVGLDPESRTVKLPAGWRAT